MKFNFQIFITISATVFFCIFSYSQKRDEDLGTEVVNVVKAYTPTVSDAFKVKETPNLDDEDNVKKETITYNIFSFPVASTFTPSKGRAAGVDKAKKEELYKNYLIGGIGNYINILGELYVTENVRDHDYVTGMVKHFSSQGGIKGLGLDDKFLNSSIDLTYGSKSNDYQCNVDAGYNLKKFFYYGLPDTYAAFYLPEVRQAVVNRIDANQTYNDASIGGRAAFGEGFANSISLKYNRFWDAYSSAENRFVIKPSFAFEVLDNKIKVDIIADYVGGNFVKDYNALLPIKYGFTNLGLHPSYALAMDDWSFDIGATGFYSVDTENSNNKFFVYPNVNASLKLVGDMMVFYAGVDGTLQQNSYRDYANENQYVSPTLNIVPTDKQFDAFGGLKGKLSNYISYNVRGSLISERYKPLFVNNLYNDNDDAINFGKEEYQYGNSFNVIYDNVKTLRFFGELKADFSKDVSAGLNATFNKYATDREPEAWNLPQLKIGANLDVAITDKWSAGADLFYVGERKDFESKLAPITGLPIARIIKLDSYFDANAHLGYKYNERLSAFLRVNNIANDSYQKWFNYPVQAIQVMLGATYKFDF